MSRNLYRRATRQLLISPILVGTLLFLPAGTFDYWEAWVFSAVFFACNLVLTAYLMLRDPKLLERRMNIGPSAEKETTQKIIVVLAFVFFAGLVIVPALARRFVWSHVPTPAVLFGDALVGLSYVGFFLVLRENTYSAASIQVEQGQTVISTGPYAVIRHPLYAAALVMSAGIPPALGSWWGLALLAPTTLVLIWRSLEEEKTLRKQLAGYSEYAERVRYRLVPFVW